MSANDTHQQSAAPLAAQPASNRSLAVVVVSDFEPEEDKTWRDEAGMVAALAQQTIEAPFELVLVESDRHRHAPPPPAISATFPGLEIVYHASEASATLKDFGVARVTTPWVAVFEADAAPEPDWLRLVCEHAQAHPEFAIFSGRTYYGEETTWRRALNLIDRSFDDLGRSGPAYVISNNGALYRTDVLRRFPYPEAGTPFLSARLREQAIARAGHLCYFVRDAVTRHAVGGFGFMFDVHRNTGYSDVMMGKTRRWTLPLEIAARRFKNNVGQALRLGGQYLRWYDWPLWLLLLFATRVPEMIGALDAMRGVKTIPGSAYR